MEKLTLLECSKRKLDETYNNAIHQKLSQKYLRRNEKKSSFLPSPFTLQIVPSLYTQAILYLYV